MFQLLFRPVELFGLDHRSRDFWQGRGWDGLPITCCVCVKYCSLNWVVLYVYFLLGCNLWTIQGKYLGSRNLLIHISFVICGKIS